MTAEAQTKDAAWDALRTADAQSIDLVEGALLIAGDEYPESEIDACRQMLAEHETALQARVVDVPPGLARLRALNEYLFESERFQGNDDDYYDPRNSYLNQVLTRRLGNPISLSILQIALGRSLGLEIEGVSFPGHFLTSLNLDDGVVVLDPYHRGRSLSLEELRKRASSYLKAHPFDDEQMSRLLDPAQPRSILGRILRNLKQLYSERGEIERALRCSDRLVTLFDDTDPDERRDRGSLYQQAGHMHAAILDWRDYLQRKPDAEDAAAIRAELIVHARPGPRLN